MTNLKGYMGKVLFVDLTNKTHSEFPWTDEDRKRTIGGKIMAADILLQHIRPGMKAFDEDNWLVISTGPLTRCKSPSSTRFNISTVSPLTGILTSSNCGGPFGRRLKKAGWDAMVITGRASELTWIEIVDDEITFHDVPEFKGMLTGEVQKQFKGGITPLVIGPAGENKVLYAGVFSGERTAGRGGVGAVFGDKNLKVITAKGTQDPEIYDQERLDFLNEQWKMQLLRHPITGAQLSKLGTAGLVAPMQAHRILATKNFSRGRFDNFEKVSGEELAEKYLVGNGNCYSCPMRCERRVKLDGKNIKGPELETLGLLGPNIMNDDLEKIIRWNYELDELGMDTISCAGSIAFAMELNEKGMWDSGLEFGKTDNLSEVFKDIAYRRGIGDILADGTKRMSEKFGGDGVAFGVGMGVVELPVGDHGGQGGFGGVDVDLAAGLRHQLLHRAHMVKVAVGQQDGLELFALQGVQNGVRLIAGIDDHGLAVIGQDIGIGLIQSKSQLPNHLCLRSISSTVSRMRVTGPSLTDSTFMSAPKRPCWGS